jgi:hypothetical protein
MLYVGKATRSFIYYDFGVLGTELPIVFFKLIQMSSPFLPTSVTYLIPVVAFFWGLLDNEMLTRYSFWCFYLDWGVFIC